MSKTSARHQALQEFLSARGYATIEELARHFEVTPQTVRKDINALAEEGKVQRFHGGAGMVSGSENIVYDERKGICQEEKRRIGALLATHIPDGVSVCINIGIGWGFSNFMEGIAGFGTAVAIPAAMLVPPKSIPI